MTEQLSQIPPPPSFTPEDIGPRCLVTGGAGYLGTAIVRRLRDIGCSVRSFDLMEHQSINGSEAMVGDIRNEADLAAACEGIDTVFHTAALINLLSVYRKAERDLVHGVNVEGTEKLLRAAAAAGCSSLVQTSTFNVVLDGEYALGDESLPYVKDAPDLYTQTKILAEVAVLGADQPGGLRTAALRPGGIWSSDTGSVMIGSILESSAAGRFTMLIGDGHATMDNTHIGNLLDAQLLAARGLRENADTVGGQAYFIVDDEHVNGLEWFRPLVEGLGLNFPQRRISAGLMRRIAYLMEIIHFLGGPDPALTRRAIRTLTESSSFSCAKAERDLGYKPRFNRANGIPLLLPAARAFIEEYRANGGVARRSGAIA